MTIIVDQRRRHARRYSSSRKPHAFSFQEMDVSR